MSEIQPEFICFHNTAYQCWVSAYVCELGSHLIFSNYLRYDLLFTKIYPSLPIIHRARFMANTNTTPLCLRYAMWTLAASSSDKHDGLQGGFYQRSRRHAEGDEMRGRGESTTSLGHCQAWILMATYEFKQMLFPRAWLSAGRAARLAQMMQLHRVDEYGDGGAGDANHCVPPEEWTRREERRRTFWMAFCIDRYTSIAAGWPMTIDERDVSPSVTVGRNPFVSEKQNKKPDRSRYQRTYPQAKRHSPRANQ